MKIICNKCLVEKDTTDFYKRKPLKHGVQGHCKVCEREIQRTNYSKDREYAERRNIENKKRQQLHKQRINEYKQSFGCKCCPETELCCLDLHHLDPTVKEFGIGSSVHYSWARIEEELTKCVVVCRNCHSKIHAGVISCT